jgi:plastocyanin
VRQGDTIVFKQFWNGEPHSITAGSLVDDPFQAFWPILKVGPPFPQAPPDTPEVKAGIEKIQKLPAMLSQSPGLAFAQNAAQPCYLDTGAPPVDEKTPCAKRVKPAFNGRQAYYSSGILPYEGDQGNTFRMPIAADATPGTHYYYCTLHFVPMSGAITIVAKDAKIPTQAEVNTQAQTEIAKFTGPAAKIVSDVRAGKSPVKGNLVGIPDDPKMSLEVTEFVPKSVKTRPGEKLTWHFVGSDFHTISFDVPKYFPEVLIGKDGTVTYPEQVYKAVGSPEFPQASPGGGPPQPGQAPPPPVHLDAGNYDGSTFLSSGVGGQSGPDQDVTWSVTFTKAGTYKFACLVHPQMVGEVVVG